MRRPVIGLLAAIGLIAVIGLWPVPTNASPVVAPAEYIPCADTTTAFDYVMFGHLQYHATGEVLDPVPMPSSIPFPGPVVLTVTRNLNIDPPGFGPPPVRDGYASCLPVGTKLHSYFGQPVSTRLVAETCTGYRVYEPL